jgi:hypothetical protein
MYPNQRFDPAARSKAEELTMHVKISTFRLLAVGVGATILSLTAYVSGIYWIAVGAGVAFGICGLLIDHFTDSHFGRGQVSAWMLVAGGAALIFLNARWPFLLSDGYGGWTVMSQYVASVVLIWGALLFLLPHRSSTVAHG